MFSETGEVAANSGKEEELYQLWQEQYDKILETSEQTHKIPNRIDQEDARVLKKRGDLENNLEETKKKFVDTINSLEKDVDNLKVQYNDDFLEEEANNQIELLDQMLQQNLEQMHTINHNEELIGFNVTEFIKLDEI